MEKNLFTISTTSTISLKLFSNDTDSLVRTWIGVWSLQMSRVCINVYMQFKRNSVSVSDVLILSTIGSLGALYNPGFERDPQWFIRFMQTSHRSKWSPRLVSKVPEHLDRCSVHKERNALYSRCYVTRGFAPTCCCYYDNSLSRRFRSTHSNGCFSDQTQWIHR